MHVCFAYQVFDHFVAPHVVRANQPQVLTVRRGGLALLPHCEDSRTMCDCWPPSDYSVIIIACGSAPRSILESWSGIKANHDVAEETHHLPRLLTTCILSSLFLSTNYFPQLTDHEILFHHPFRPRSRFADCRSSRRPRKSCGARSGFEEGTHSGGSSQYSQQQQRRERQIEIDFLDFGTDHAIRTSGCSISTPESAPRAVRVETSSGKPHLCFLCLKKRKKHELAEKSTRSTNRKAGPTFKKHGVPNFCGVLFLLGEASKSTKSTHRVPARNNYPGQWMTLSYANYKICSKMYTSPCS